jgi:hypothetical protein
MAGLIVFEPGTDWSATGGLFDWTLEFLEPHLSDSGARARLREIVSENLGSLWIPEFRAEIQKEIGDALRADLVAAAERDLPPGDAKGAAVEQLRQLADLAGTWVSSRPK